MSNNLNVTFPIKKVIVWGAMSIMPPDWTVLERVVKERKVKKVVEFGSGVSTQLFDKLGIQVESYETNIKWVEHARMIAPHADVRIWDGELLPDIEGDMVLIDAPHGGINREVSYKSVYLSGIPIVACHDVKRPEDFQWIEKYFGDWRIIDGVLNPIGLLVLERE